MCLRFKQIFIILFPVIKISLAITLLVSVVLALRVIVTEEWTFLSNVYLPLMRSQRALAEPLHFMITSDCRIYSNITIYQQCPMLSTLAI